MLHDLYIMTCLSFVISISGHESWLAVSTTFGVVCMFRSSDLYASGVYMYVYIITHLRSMCLLILERRVYIIC